MKSNTLTLINAHVKNLQKPTSICTSYMLLKLLNKDRNNSDIEQKYSPDRRRDHFFMAASSTVSNYDDPTNTFLLYSSPHIALTACELLVFSYLGLKKCF